MSVLATERRLSPATADRLRLRWDEGALRVGDELKLGPLRYLVIGFDPVSVFPRRLHLTNLETGLTCTLRIPRDSG